MFVFPGAMALRAGITTSTLVYRQGGTWYNQLEAGMDMPDVTQVDTDAASGLLLFFTRPTVVPDSLYAEMSANALTPADPSWTPGTLTPA